ncbi:MAG: lipoprotein [Rhodospirillales bacterium]|nr:lipoprotein [Rhodospirillales bacterium]
MMRLLTVALLMVLVAASVTACGRKGAPDAPPGSTYPAQYPHQ